MNVFADKCSTCAAPLVHANGKLICPKPACPGHKEGGER